MPTSGSVSLVASRLLADTTERGILGFEATRRRGPRSLTVALCYVVARLTRSG